MDPGNEHHRTPRLVQVLLFEQPQLHALCVMAESVNTPHSAAAAQINTKHRGPGVAQSGLCVEAPAWNWVTTRSLGIAHPICALEVMHDAGGGLEGSQSDGEMHVSASGATEAGRRNAVPSLRTLRLTSDTFETYFRVRILIRSVPVHAFTQCNVSLCWVMHRQASAHSRGPGYAMFAWPACMK